MAFPNESDPRRDPYENERDRYIDRSEPRSYFWPLALLAALLVGGILLGISVPDNTSRVSQNVERPAPTPLPTPPPAVVPPTTPSTPTTPAPN
jgi:hypothetical protein